MDTIKWQNPLNPLSKGHKSKNRQSRVMVLVVSMSSNVGQYLCPAHQLILLNICLKCDEDILKVFHVTEPTQLIFSVSKGHNSKIRQYRVMVLVFCMLSNVVCVKLSEDCLNGFSCRGGGGGGGGWGWGHN